METSLTFAASPSRSMWFNHGVLQTRFPTMTGSTSSSFSHARHLTRRKAASSIKALKTTPSSQRRTLSNNWDVSQDLYSVTSDPWLPRFEELDTTNMLLRQRIIFLGSQVLVPSSLGIVNAVFIYFMFPSFCNWVSCWYF